MRKINSPRILAILCLVFFLFNSGCKHDDTVYTDQSSTPVNDMEQVVANVSGIVMDENNAPINGALVTSGTVSTTTNAQGLFSFRNISLSKSNGSVTVTKTGYFKGVRSFKTTAGKSHQLKIQLMQRSLSGSVNAATGGTINSNGGATINFPANAFVTSSGVAYTGSVKVYSRWIDPTASNLSLIIPGDLRGVNINGTESVLQTYGMIGAELEDASGNALKIASGKKAVISAPIPAGLATNAPNTIPMWHFDDATARWKEDGTGTRSGNTYTAQVDKFSFWNYDVSLPPINLDLTLIDAAGSKPLASVDIRFKNVTNNSYGYAITNGEGYAALLIPKNTVLVMEVVNMCGTVVYTQNIGPFQTNTSLGNINITLQASQVLSFTGKLVDCNASAVSNGYLNFAFVWAHPYSTLVSVNASGTFSFSTLNCPGTNLPYAYQGVDNTTNQQSAVMNGIAANGAVNLGNVAACSITYPPVDIYLGGFTENIAQNRFAEIWKNGVGTALTNGVRKTLVTSIFVSGTNVYATGYDNGGGFAGIIKYWKNGTETNLTTGATIVTANSIYVSNGDVYIVGSERASAGQSIATAKIWKNGVPTDLTTGVTTADATGVFVSGTDVYVCGWEQDAVGYSTAKMWKNGVATDLTPTTTGYHGGRASSLYVSGSDVYVAGYELTPPSYQNLKVWKNGIGTNVTAPIFNGGAEINSIFVSGTDVYVAGSTTSTGGRVAKYWKNGIETQLISGLTGDADAYAIYVIGSRVFVGGWEKISSNTSTAKLWENGLPTNLTDGTNNAEVRAIFVK